MTSNKICQLASCATNALDKSVCAIVSVAALEQYNCVVEYIKNITCIDINEFFGYIALLALLCWVSQWLAEIFNFMCKTIPKFMKNLFCGKFSLCLLDCDKKCDKSSKSSKSCKSSSSKCPTPKPPKPPKSSCSYSSSSSCKY
jgi:hypothetical protein